MAQSPLEELASVLRDPSKVMVSKAQLSTTIKGTLLNMDCLMTMPVPTTAEGYDVLGVFHIGGGVGPNKGKTSQLYLAGAKTSNLLVWTVVNGEVPYSNEGSQGALALREDGVVFLTHEIEDYTNGNHITIKRYSNVASLLTDTYEARVDLTQQIHQAVSPDSWSPTPSQVRNVGTPTIEGFAGTDLKIRMHYSPDGVHDVPALGMVSFPPGKMSGTAWGSYFGAFDNWVNDAIHSLGAAGKIGGRDSVLWGGSRIYLFESQIIQDNWSSWRPFILDPATREADFLRLTVSGTTSFCNPHMTLLPNGYLLQTYFVPSERNGSLAPGTYLRVTDVTQALAAQRRKSPTTTHAVQLICVVLVLCYCYLVVIRTP